MNKEIYLALKRVIERDELKSKKVDKIRNADIKKVKDWIEQVDINKIS
jgi:hypothetical protein